MRIGNKTITRVATILAIISWVALVYTNETQFFSSINGLKPDFQEELPRLLLSFFILMVFVFYKFKIEKSDTINFVDLLWRVFVTGLIITMVSLAFRLFLTIIGPDGNLSKNGLFINFIYLSNLGLVCAYLVSTFIVWKRLIIYQKSKFLLRAWKIFEYALLLSLLYEIFPFPFLEEFGKYYTGGLVLLGIFLSANMKWVAYLNFKQKWKSILLILLAMFYLGYYTFTLFSFTIDLSDVSPYFIDFQDHVFITAILAFIFIYALFSLLVILFNLPTSSVFEQKLEEVVNFQRLSQSIQTEQSEDRVYDILLESAVSTVFADAAWIEINENGNREYHTFNITQKDIETLKNFVKQKNIKGIFDAGSDKSRNIELIKGSRFRSIMSSPIMIKQENLGRLVLLKDVTDGFNREMHKIIGTFTNQAGISIENFRLLSEALENERYKEELKIAKKVQQSLLPDQLESNVDYEIVAFSEAADEVGGDYYDTFRINPDRIALVISDVSGKGTSAAFHMSQMKGMFHSLSQLDMSSGEFMIRANDAMARCLDKASFVTTSYFIIDSANKSIEFSRAGHCPTLYYNKARDEASYFKNKGLGLGIIRNNSYKEYVEVNTISYEPGDVMVLYTDGITEAKNRQADEFGYERLRNALKENKDRPASEIQRAIIERLFEFTGNDAIDDDYTTVIIKFH